MASSTTKTRRQQQIAAESRLKFRPAEAKLAQQLRDAAAALEQGEWEVVRGAVEPWLKGNKEDGEAVQLLRQSYLRPAQAALEQGDIAHARA